MPVAAVTKAKTISTPIIQNIPPIDDVTLIDTDKAITQQAILCAKDIAKRHKKNIGKGRPTVVLFGNCPRLSGKGDLFQLIIKQELFYKSNLENISIGINAPTENEKEDQKKLDQSMKNQPYSYDDVLADYFSYALSRTDTTTKIKKIHAIQAKFKNIPFFYDGMKKVFEQIERQSYSGYCLGRNDVAAVVESPYYKHISINSPFIIETPQSARQKQIIGDSNKGQFLQAVHCINRINERVEKTPGLTLETCDLDILFNRTEKAGRPTIDILNLFDNTKADVIAIGLWADNEEGQKLYNSARENKKTMPGNLSFFRFSKKTVSVGQLDYDKDWSDVCFNSGAGQFQIQQYSHF